MSSETIAAILGALVGGICTAIVTFITISIQRKRRIIGFEVSSIPLVKFMSATEQGVKLTADKFLLTGQPEDKGVFTPIDSAYGFEITLRNDGNEDIENPKIELHFDPSAKIVAYETQPGNTPAYAVTVQKDDLHPNVIRFSVPFINRNSRFLIRFGTAPLNGERAQRELARASSQSFGQRRIR